MTHLFQESPLRRPTLWLIAVLSAVAMVATILTVPAFATVTTGTAGLFVPVQGRLVDTTVPTGVTTKAPLAPLTPVTVQVTGKAGVPTSGVTAVLITFTTLSPTVAGQSSAGPANGDLSGVMRYKAGQPTSNSAIVELSPSGQMKIQTTTASNVQIDVQGYYTSGNGTTAPGGYSPVDMKRTVDTVNGVGLPKAKLAGGQTYTVKVTGTADVPAGSKAVFVNFQVDNTTSTAGSINPFATSATSRPNVTLAFAGVPYTSIGAVVPLDSTGSFKLYVSPGSSINLLMDVEGYFTAGSSNGSFTPAVGKIYDTRSKPTLAVKPNQTVTVPIAGTNGLPATTDGFSSAALNLTVIDPGTAGGSARAYADGEVEPIGVGAMTFAGGETRTNLVTVPVGLNGAILIHNRSTDTVNYIVDLEGFYRNTSSTLCANDVDEILGDASNPNAPTVGAAEGEPVISAVPWNSLGDSLQFEVHLVNSSGSPVGGSPVIKDEVESGEPVVYHLPTDKMVAGQKYTWWVHASQDDMCVSSATSPHHTFTYTKAPAPSLGAVQTTTITGASLAVASATTGATDCAGEPCALQAGKLAIGEDANGLTHYSSLKADLSSIPAGASITSAKLTLHPTCFGTQCMGAKLSVDPASSDVSGAATGADLPGLLGEEGYTFAESSATEEYDITDLVSSWQGASNTGAVLRETGTVPSGSTGAEFAGPAAAANPAKLEVKYIPATTPGAVTSLKVTPGDGGLIATWNPPADTGWQDPSGDTNGITQYQASVACTGKPVIEKQVTRNRLVVNGLTNGIGCDVNVSASNKIGSGPSTSVNSVKPVAVPGGTALYKAQALDLLKAQSKLQGGTAFSSVDAAAGTGQPELTAAAASLDSPGQLAVYLAEVASSQVQTSSVSSFSDVLAVPFGGRVLFYATTTENIITQDTSGTTPEDIAGSQVVDDAFMFEASATAPRFLSRINAAGLLQTVSASAFDTLTTADPGTPDDAPSIEFGPDGVVTPAAASQEAKINTSLAMDAPMAAAAASSTLDRAKVVKWANDNVNGGTNGYDAMEDCTDFVSRALRAGGLQQRSSGHLKRNDQDLRNWYHVAAGRTHSTWYSKTWGLVTANYTHMRDSRGGVSTLQKDARPGDLAYAD